MEYSSFTWPACFILLDYILDHLKDFNGKILEIGSGTGYLSNALDSKGLDILASDYKIDGIKSKKVKLDWNLESDYLQFHNAFDIIIGSDVFYDSKDFENILLLVKKCLKVNGRFITAYHERNMTFSITWILFKLNLKSRKLLSNSSIHIYEITNNIQRIGSKKTRITKLETKFK